MAAVQLRAPMRRQLNCLFIARHLFRAQAVPAREQIETTAGCKWRCCLSSLGHQRQNKASARKNNESLREARRPLVVFIGMSALLARLLIGALEFITRQPLSVHVIVFRLGRARKCKQRRRTQAADKANVNSRRRSPIRRAAPLGVGPSRADAGGARFGRANEYNFIILLLFSCALALEASSCHLRVVLLARPLADLFLPLHFSKISHSAGPSAESTRASRDLRDFNQWPLRALLSPTWRQRSPLPFNRGAERSARFA